MNPSIHLFSLIALLLLAFPSRGISQATFEDYRRTIVAQWNTVRSDPSSNKGKTVRWAFKVSFVTKVTHSFMGGEYDLPILDGTLDIEGRCKVEIVYSLTTAGNPSHDPDKDPKVGDWVIVEGTFDGITDEGEVQISATNVLNAGYKGSGDSP